ncbi:leucine-rich repeat receptor-like tyrosine-protein kinase PXC3 [Argentina anserina]|uniref:leucine-rich repeat receptor-like tyrosine-protein kinase PXC3 n=1 Tax=Argentina anserina TaxID=57926 RepID=UPI0021767BE1|nr:leucine-rich repeat receptor-like tyrosine-protein kinase PXC3 [Potentilla anserina]
MFHSHSQLTMARYSCFFHFLLFCYSLIIPVALSELSSTQKTTMINISKSLNSSGSSVPWNINTEPNPCLWKGVECDPPTNSSVIHITLSKFSLSSSDFLPVLCQLGSLQIVDVSENRLSTIPSGFLTACGNIDGLKLLNFSFNNLAGSLPDFTGFVGLESLDLSHNKMSGAIESDLGGLVRLRSFNLGFNHFSGTIPTQLGKSMLLEELVLSANTFQGRIPSEILGYGNLTRIDFSANNLSGSVPENFGVLSKLEFLILSSNSLSGKIPQSLSNITSLRRFAANSNKFGGAVPGGITKHLQNLDLSYNSLSGMLPSDLLSPSNLNLETVDLSNNLLQGSIPTPLSPNLVRLRLGNNSLVGMIPSATLQNLVYLELENNKLNGPIPPELGSCRKLALLNLAQNGLIGALPPQLGNLTELQVLKLQSNNLGGEIPTQITRLPNLSVLNISWNALSGSIPTEVSKLQKLINMNLQGNNLSGSIPNTIATMSYLLELQLGHNFLSGDIPRMPTSLQITLNLSSNRFEGPIPTHLSSLTGLEILDLSNNKFSGQIPSFFTNQLAALTQLILSNNQLSGVIPSFNSRVIVNTTGNSGLINATTPSIAKKRNSKALPIALAVVAAVVAIVAIAILAISLSRHSYRVNDEQVDSGEDLPRPEVLQDSLLTANAIHRSSIDFTTAMEVVSDPSNIELKTRFSTYYKATMPSGSSYFVKKLNWTDKIFQLGSHDRFENDLQIFGKLTNSNVMTPLAYVTTADSAYLLYEFAPKGTLFYALHCSSDNAMDWASRYSSAVGIAQGLAFLHGCTSGPILLLDLSSRSIFLKSLKEPLIGDAELCKVIDPSKSTGSVSTVAGSVGYIPPEYAYTMRVTVAGNIYSFGVILLELLTGKPAVSEGIELANWVLRNSGQHDKLLDSTISRTSSAIRSQMLTVLKVALGCVTASPEARPRMKSVLRMLLNAR